jgi:HK97 family phage prohead protease
MLELKAVPAEYKVDAKQRIVEGYASSFGNVDFGRDVVEPGAYTKTLAEDFPAGRIKVKRDHEHFIGRPLHMEQDSKGLFTRSAISRTPLGDETLILVEDGVIDCMSIGYKAEVYAPGQRDGQKVRLLQQVRLREYSLLATPMNEQAVITGVKSLYDVAYTLDRMSDALSHLRSLSYTPPEIARRLTALIQELGDVPPPAPSPAAAPQPDPAADALRELLGEFTAFLTKT